MYAVGWLAGIIDGEGTVFNYARKNRISRNRAVKISNTTVEIIERAESCLKLLEIPYRVNLKSHTGYSKKGNPCAPCYTIIIGTRGGIEKLADAIDLAHPTKHHRLKAMPLSYTNVAPTLDVALIRKLVLEDELGFGEVAKILGVKYHVVRYVAHRNGIHRSRSSILRSSWKNRDKESFRDKMRQYWTPENRASAGKTQSATRKRLWAERQKLLDAICPPEFQKNPRVN